MAQDGTASLVPVLSDPENPAWAWARRRHLGSAAGAPFCRMALAVGARLYLEPAHAAEAVAVVLDGSVEDASADSYLHGLVAAEFSPVETRVGVPTQFLNALCGMGDPAVRLAVAGAALGQRRWSQWWVSVCTRLAVWDPFSELAPKADVAPAKLILEVESALQRLLHVDTPSIQCAAPHTSGIVQALVERLEASGYQVALTSDLPVQLKDEAPLERERGFRVHLGPTPSGDVDLTICPVDLRDAFVRVECPHAGVAQW